MSILNPDLEAVDRHTTEWIETYNRLVKSGTDEATAYFETNLMFVSSVSKELWEMKQCAKFEPLKG